MVCRPRFLQTLQGAFLSMSKDGRFLLAGSLFVQSKHLKGRLDPPVSDGRFCLSVCNVFVSKHLKGRLDPPVSDVCLSVCLFVTKNDHFAQRSL